MRATQGKTSELRAVASASDFAEEVERFQISGEPSGELSGKPSLDVFEFQAVTLQVTTERRGAWRWNSRISITQKLQPGQAEYFAEALSPGLALEMVRIPAGTFLMGAVQGEEGASDEEYPQHQVTVPEFFLGKFAVTQAQYQAVMGHNPSAWKGDRHPVEQVSWDDAQTFCQTLSQLTGRHYRLPSEAEWEYACRAGTTTPFHVGETISTDLANYQGQDWVYEGSTYPGRYGLGQLGSFRGETTTVGAFSPNAFGLYDMHGNVWEWCEDRWHDDYRGAPADASVWEAATGKAFYVMRGGAWPYGPWVCRSANRGYFAPYHRDSNIGFRVVCPRP